MTDVIFHTWDSVIIIKQDRNLLPKTFPLLETIVRHNDSAPDIDSTSFSLKKKKNVKTD